jgi:prepilin-type N-terminal cleavage/methylation domain-containing protein
MQRRSRLNYPTAGFTLIEVLVVIILIGIVFAIATPGWDTFLSRQRVSTGREQVVQMIRQAQSEARTTRSPKVVVFDVNPANGVPRVGYTSCITPTSGSPSCPVPVPTTAITNWKSLGGDSVQRGALVMRTSNTNNQLAFDGDGNVGQPPRDVSTNQFSTLPNSPDPGFGVTVSRGNSTGNVTYRCVIINTLLGATRLAEGASCP